eukprot:332261_1
MANLQHISKINQKRKDTVSGFIRTNFIQKFPNDLFLICVLFYGPTPDHFDPNCIANVMTLNEENQSVTQIKDQMASCYLKRIVHSGHYIWKFKIEHCKNNAGGWMMIGIWRVQQDTTPPLDSFFTRGQQQGYGYSTCDGTISNSAGGYTSKSYGIKVPTGSTVTMILDFDSLSLSFKVDDEDYGKSHHINADSYRAAVYMGRKDDCIRLLSYCSYDQYL